MGNFYNDFIAPEQDDDEDINNNSNIDSNNYFVPSDDYQEGNEEDGYPDSRGIDYINSRPDYTVGENKKNLEEFDTIMDNASKKDDSYIDRNNPFMKIFMIIFWIVVVGGLAYYIVSWLMLS